MPPTQCLFWERAARRTLDSLIMGLAWFLNIYYFIRQQVWRRLWCSGREWADLLVCLFDELLFILTGANPRYWGVLWQHLGSDRSIAILEVLTPALKDGADAHSSWPLCHVGSPFPSPLCWAWSQRQIIRWVMGSSISLSAVKLGVLPHSSQHIHTDTHTNTAGVS